MEPRLSRAEYWLLETVVEARVPLNWLGGDGDFITVLNKVSHGLDRAGIAAALDQMFEAGWLYAHWGRSELSFRPKRSEIEQALAARDATFDGWLYYGLTALGGDTWEAFARPRWERFVDEIFFDSEDDPHETAVLFAADRAQLERRFRWICELGFHPHSDHRPLADTARWETLHPWQATYWKQLPIGYRLEYRFGPRSDESAARPAWDCCCRLPRWYDWGDTR